MEESSEERPILAINKSQNKQTENTLTSLNVKCIALGICTSNRCIYFLLQYVINPRQH